MEPIEVRFQYTEKEYIQASRQYMFMSKLLKKSDIILPIVLLPTSVLYMFLTEFDVLSIVLCVCAVVYLMIIATLYYLIPKVSYKQNAKYQEEYYLSFSEEGIKFRTNTINSDLQWEVYKKLLENEEYFYLCQNKQIYSVIPKRAFQGEETMLQFKELALEKVSAVRQ